MNSQSQITSQKTSRLLTAKQFQQLAEIPAELEWLANIQNEHTRKAYQRDVRSFMGFVGIELPGELSQVTRAHVIAWRDELQAQGLSAATIRRKLSALSALFDFLCEKNSVTHNPVDGVKRPAQNSNEGSTPAISNEQAMKLLNAPDVGTLKGKRDRAILATLLYHGLRREEVCKLKVKDYHLRQGVWHFRVEGKRSKVRYIPVAPVCQQAIACYVEFSGHGDQWEGALFRPIKNNVTGTLNKHLHPNTIYYNVVHHYGDLVGILSQNYGFCVHSLRATAATNALENEADIARVQEWLGHSNISTTRLYDKRGAKVEESPTFRVKY